jgi:enoyl-CoA hydratase/carnithine racemase
MTYETITYEIDRGVGLVTLNRPDKLNAINHRMVDELLDVQSKVESDDSVKVLVLTGRGRSFCAGYDMKEADEGEKKKRCTRNTRRAGT